ncbi:hypothetical protein GR7B_00231 [Vibrio phage vB_VcorM_GR7B]|nr:hypothetical protein GR7B_00231 [Vibrio phage vB_VcorM_GR7B]
MAYDNDTEIAVTSLFKGDPWPVGKWVKHTDEDGEVESVEIIGYDSHKQIVTLRDENGCVFTKDPFDNYWVHCKPIDTPSKPHQIVAEAYLKRFNIIFADEVEDPDDPTAVHHLAWMLRQIVDDSLSSDTKANRWLGFVQGTLVLMGHLDVEEERENTRGIFNGA